MRMGLIERKVMTPQQVRLFHLQASRNYGPFTAAEQATLNSEAPHKRREATAPDFTAYIRLAPAHVSLQDLKTVQMPGE